MASVRTCLLAALLVRGAMCMAISNEAALQSLTDNALLDSMSEEAMQEVFARSDETHQEAMGYLMRTMTVERASDVLMKSNYSSTELAQVIQQAKGTSKGKLRAPPAGYAGLDGARKMLNGMIYKAMEKYDIKIRECTQFYASQCAAMEVLRGDISAANYVAANSRSYILDAQATINVCEVDIPTNKLNLKQHIMKCDHELGKMYARLKIVLGDIAIMTTILEMTDCDKQLFQTSLLSCYDECQKKSFISFSHNELKDQVAKLQSTLSKNLFQDEFKDMLPGIEGLQEAVALVQTSDSIAPVINKTKYNNPPTPHTMVPGNPCADPFKGAPSTKDKRSAKCTLGKTAECYKLQERFLLIQSGIKDERDNLMQSIASLKEECAETKDTLEKKIADDEELLEESQTGLAKAMSKEAKAGEKARTTAAANEQATAALKKKMKACSDAYVASETELCALKKIRGELYKMKGTGSAFFQDCEMSKWDPEECTKSCATGGQPGKQILSRSVVSQPNGGAKCLPDKAVVKCADQPCPQDCVLEPWTRWSKCSAECGGGVKQRLREVRHAMKYGGHPCGKTSQTIACNSHACEQDCVLSDWTVWSGCSKDCDGGTQKRMKFVKEQPEGAGKCADQWSLKRLEYKKCNEFSCNVAATSSLKCAQPIDVVLLLDGSGSLGQTGWDAEIKAANNFVDTFADSSGKTDAQLSVILYSGPRTWGGVRQCFGNSKVDMETVCKIKKVSEFTNDLTKVKGLINGLTWPKGSTLTSLALMTAKAMLSLGRAEAKSIVVTITDGRPLSYRATGIASRLIRKSARLVWVPVTKFAPLGWIKRWATRRWQENVVKVDSFDELEDKATITHIIANICPNAFPKIVTAQR